MHTDPSFLQIVWFVLIGILWTGFFVLEGFDFGVGVLVKALARDDVEKRMTIHAIGPVWDGNEVWLLVAGGATFAAFPSWYATTFSGFYLPLFLVLAALIVRGVSFEFWGKVESASWRNSWEWACAIASGAAALLFGVAWANFVHGVPMGANHIVRASVWQLLNPYALLGGLTTLSVFTAHGCGFLALRVDGDLRDRAAKLADRIWPVAAVLGAAFIVWTMEDQGWNAAVVAMGVLTILAALITVAVVRRRQEGRGFALSALTIALFTATLAVALYPNALPSSTSSRFDLSLHAASSSHYTLVVMTIVAIIFVPIVLAYQSWSYWIFRHRLGRDDYEGPVNPVAVIDHKLGGSKT